MSKFSYLYTGSALSMVIDGVPFNVDNSHPSFDAILQAVKENRVDDIPDLVSVARAVNEFGHGKVTVDEDEGLIRYDGEVVHNTLTDRILQMVGEGFTVEPFVNFLEKLMANPSKRAVDEEYTFLEYGKLPITEDGCFLAYKRVQDNYLDVHSGTVLNKMASQLTEAELAKLPYTTDRGVTVELVDGVVTVSMPRNKVDDRSERTCSEGLHFCSLEYLKNFVGDHVMILKINPADVVSIPVDYNHTKGRTWKYQVVGEYKGSMTDPAFTKSVVELGETEDTDTLEWSAVADENDFSEGYREGYPEGRRHNFPRVTADDLLDGGTYSDSAYGEGYVVGYRDGKNHRGRRY